MLDVILRPKAFEDIQFWLKHDVKTLRKIMTLIDNAQRTPFEGLGKPEPLRQNLQGYWSRRINREHRLVYKVEEETLIILQCRYHYE